MRTGGGSERGRLSAPGRRCWRRGSHAAGAGPGRGRCPPGARSAVGRGAASAEVFVWVRAVPPDGARPRGARAAPARLDQGGDYHKHPGAAVVSIHTVMRLLAAARRVRHPDVDWERARFSHCLRGGSLRSHLARC